MRENLTLHADGICVFLRFSLYNASGIRIAKQNWTNRVDSVDGIGNVRGLFAKTTIETSKAYENLTQKDRGFHSYRVVSRYCHHRHSGRLVAACLGSRQSQS